MVRGNKNGDNGIILVKIWHNGRNGPAIRNNGQNGIVIVLVGYL